MNQSTGECPVETAVNMIDGKWKIIIIARLSHFGRHRFGELGRSIPAINERMLSRQLRELESDGLVVRKVFAEVPPRVEYGLTKNGETLVPILESLADWGRQQKKLLQKKAEYTNVSG